MKNDTISRKVSPAFKQPFRRKTPRISRKEQR